jgi:hypothetical protein
MPNRAVGDGEAQRFDVLRAEPSQRRSQFFAALNSKRRRARVSGLAIRDTHYAHRCAAPGQSMNQSSRAQHFVIGVRTHHDGRHEFGLPRRLRAQENLPSRLGNAGLARIELSGFVGCHII